MEGKFVKKALLNIVRDKKKKRIKAYYLGVLFKGQSPFIRVLNYFSYRLLVLLGAFLFFLYFTEGQRPLSAFCAGVSVLVIYHLAESHLFNKKFSRLKQDVNFKIGEEEFWRRIKTMDKEGFIAFIQEILSRLPGFSELQITENLENEGIDILCKYGAEPIAIQCQLLDGDNAVESKDARELSRAMSRRKYVKGIIISTTDFRDDTKRFCSLIKEKRKIKLLGKKELIQMAIEAGKYPSEDEINDLILKKIEYQSRIFLEAREKLFIKPRLKPYFIYGTLLFCCGLLFFEQGFKFFYFLGAAALYMLGIIGFILNLNTFKGQVNSRWQDKLF